MGCRWEEEEEKEWRGGGGGGDVGWAIWWKWKMCSLLCSGFLPASLCEPWVGECLYPWRSAGRNTNKHRRLLPLCGSVPGWRDGFVPSLWECQLCSPVCVYVWVYLGCPEAMTELQMSATLCKTHQRPCNLDPVSSDHCKTPVLVFVCAFVYWPCELPDYSCACKDKQTLFPLNRDNAFLFASEI